MYYVYILLCADGQFYTGFSGDLRQRVKCHTDGRVQSTRSRRPVKLVFCEAFLSKADAQRREMYLKSSPVGRACPEGSVGWKRKLPEINGF
jgi:putative endonuclease